MSTDFKSISNDVKKFKSNQQKAVKNMVKFVNTKINALPLDSNDKNKLMQLAVVRLFNLLVECPQMSDATGIGGVVVK